MGTDVWCKRRVRGGGSRQSCIAGMNESRHTATRRGMPACEARRVSAMRRLGDAISASPLATTPAERQDEHRRYHRRSRPRTASSMPRVRSRGGLHERYIRQPAVRRPRPIRASRRHTLEILGRRRIGEVPGIAAAPPLRAGQREVARRIGQRFGILDRDIVARNSGQALSDAPPVP